MGNCMFPCLGKDERKQDQEAEEKPGDLMKESSSSSSDFQEQKKVRIKIVLTKGELEWLILQLENHKNEKSLEEVLEEIESSRESSRGNIESWKPSLESIMECPEVLEIDR